MARYPTALLMCVLLLIAACSGGTSEAGGVKITSVRHSAGSILIEVEAAAAVASARVDVISSDGDVLCSAYKDLALGANQLEMAECPLEERIKVSVSPPGGAMAVKDVSLDLPVARVSIGDARPTAEGLLVELDSSISTPKVRVEIVSGSDVVCTKYVSLVQGDNSPVLDGCEMGRLLDKKVSVAVQPEGGSLATKEVIITAPAVELAEGRTYDYRMPYSSQGPLEITLYSTRVSSSAWEGILGVKNTNMKTATLLRFQIPKDSLGLKVTSPLALNQLDDTPAYESVAEVTLDTQATTAIIPLLMTFWVAHGLDIAEMMEKKSTSFTGKGTSTATNGVIEETTIEGGAAAYKTKFFQEGQTPMVFTISTAAPHLTLGGTIPNSGTIEYLGETKGSFDAGEYAGYSFRESGGPVLEQPRSQELRPVEEPRAPVNEEQT